MIVNTTILMNLLRTLPRAQAEAFLDAQFSNAPQFGDPTFGEWIKLSRRKLDKSQRTLASLLRSDDLPVNPCDIGNLECGYRPEHYTEERVSKIREAILADDVLRPVEILG